MVAMAEDEKQSVEKAHLIAIFSSTILQDDVLSDNQRALDRLTPAVLPDLQKERLECLPL